MTKEQFRQKFFNFCGCNCYNECPQTKSDDNLYLVSLNYCGHYEDDDCYFTYINSETGQYSYDTWTTRGACPSFSCYLRMPAQDAVKAGYLSGELLEEKIETSWKNHLNSTIDMMFKDIYRFREYIGNWNFANVPCTVSNRCRKYKGDGIFLCAFEVKPYMSWKRHNEYKAKVLGTDNKIYTVSLSHVQLKEDAVNELKDKLYAMVGTITDEQVLKSVFPYINLNIEDYVDIEAEAKLKKYLDFKTSKMPGLIEWCKSKAPEKSEDEIKQWAESIFEKKYPPIDKTVVL